MDNAIYRRSNKPPSRNPCDTKLFTPLLLAEREQKSHKCHGATGDVGRFEAHFLLVDTLSTSYVCSYDRRSRIPTPSAMLAMLYQLSHTEPHPRIPLFPFIDPFDMTSASLLPVIKRNRSHNWPVGMKIHVPFFSPMKINT